MKVIISSFSSEQYLPLSNITFEQNKKPYALKYGYEHEFCTTAPPDYYENVLKFPYGFVRIERINELLKTDTDWIWLSGSDVVITNPEIKIEDIIDPYKEFDLLVTMDISHINDDSMLIKNTQWSKDYFKMIYDMRYSGVPDEQNAIIKTYRDYPDKIKIIPQRTINSYDHSLIGHSTDHPGQWQHGDFVIHLVNMSLEKRLETVKKYIK